jgi:small subunit ribosomal protein S21
MVAANYFRTGHDAARQIKPNNGIIAESGGFFRPRNDGNQGESMTLRMRVHDREPIGLALRRFKKLMERSGLTKELRLHQHYEKPCEARRRAKLRKESAIRKSKLPPKKTKTW